MGIMEWTGPKATRETKDCRVKRVIRYFISYLFAKKSCFHENDY